jgi:Flp pilus assembly protein TadD
VTSGAERRRARDLVPALAALGVVVAWALAHRALVPAPARPGDPGALAGVAALVWAHLAWLAPWAPHAPLLDVWRTPSAAWAVLAWLATLAVLGGMVLAHRARLRIALPVALLLAPLLPVAGASLVESGVRFAERSLALPAVGLALLLAALAGSARRAGAAPRIPARLGHALLGLWVLAQVVVAWPAIGAWEDEESRIRRIASVRPRDADTQLGLADLLSTLGRMDEARAWIARAEAADPAGAAPLVARASLEFRSGRAAESLAAAERALARAPGDLAAGMIRVRALVALARAPEALAAARDLAARHGAEPPARGALGVALLANGDPAAALPPLRDASGRLLDDAGLAWDLGRAALATGDVPLAREAFERATTAAPGFYEAWLGVADTRARMGDRAGARAALARASALPGASDGRVEMLRARIER